MLEIPTSYSQITSRGKLFSTVHQAIPTAVWRGRRCAYPGNGIQENFASEFAETLIKNLELLHADQSELVSHDSISSLQQSLADLTNNLAPLHKESENNPTRNNIVQVMKFLFNDNNELDSVRDNLFRLGGAMFATSCHYIVAHTLIRNPQG